MKPELLAPAGSPEALRAAVQNGADAVYLGWGSFNARRNAKNFSDEEFAEALLYCHQRGVRVFLTLNTLVTDRELPQAVETARKACRLGIDAVLVQDWGLFDQLRTALPDLPLHASTQMSLFTSGGACEAARLGCERVVIARECSAEDTALICRRCPVEVEIFVHGALCMCYSGQCAMSALIGGRSGNRGRCAQPCRMTYGTKGPSRSHFPLSLKDSCLAGSLAAMEEMGVACLKLEGRMKRPEYVAVVTGIYARLLKEGRCPTQEEEALLEQAFSRSGFTQAYWEGRHGPDMFGTRPENAKEPKALFDAARAAYEKGEQRTVPVRFVCVVRTGKACTLTASDADGHTVTVTGPVPEAARNRPLTQEDLAARLNKTGGTGYRCAEAGIDLDEGLSLPASAVNALRRDALAALTQARTAVPARRELAMGRLPERDCTADHFAFTVSVARPEQLSSALLDLEPARVYVPLEAVDRMAPLPESTAEWCVTLPRIWRDRDEALLERWLDKARAMGFTAAAVGNLGQLPLLRESGLHLYGDFGLNVFNSWSLDFLRREGLESACASFELRGSQLRDLRKVLPTEAIIYGRLPLMITENCLTQNCTKCRLDRKGPAVPENGPCAAPRNLVDRTGAAFPLLPAFGHRTELQNSLPLWLADRPQLYRAGLAFGRLRFTTESPEDCVQVYRDYLQRRPAGGIFTRGLFDRGVE